MNDYRLGLYEKSMPGTLTLEEKLMHTRAAGFDYMEISIDETDEKLARLDMPAAGRAALREAIQKTGVPIVSMCLSGHRKYPLGSPDPATAARSLEIMEKALAFAADIGIRQIQLAGYDVYYTPGNEETRRLFAENLKKSVEMAARFGVMMGFETMETPFMNTVEKAIAYVNAMQSPYLQVYPDIGNLTNAAKADGKNVLDDLQLGRGHLSAMHLKETVPGIFREVPYGTGHVNFPAAIRCAWELGVRMFVGEFWYTGSPEWEADLQKANRFLRNQFVVAGV